MQVTRRRLLRWTAAGVSVVAMHGIAAGEACDAGPPKRARGRILRNAPTSIEVNARTIAAFDPATTSGSVSARWKSQGLVLTSRLPGFGGFRQGRDG